MMFGHIEQAVVLRFAGRGIVVASGDDMIFSFKNKIGQKKPYLISIVHATYPKFSLCARVKTSSREHIGRTVSLVVNQIVVSVLIPVRLP